ncbi:MAG TPA: peroxiredoxin [Candidatus Caldiarchaeum subterraneum]|uniref:thioredoxin-dependent peroxiredoxin n=1 Tax=Caldiarchaeum subterraneum TaxID=311458 RepID=A0A832ZYL5_CALS0|nr:peroxiredoxin [Candidatus Caldarchaeum subterraneum]
MLKEGNTLPDIKLKDQNGVEKRLYDLLKEKRYLVLYFYPRDDTPGCTKEACGFRDGIDELRRLGADVVGVSIDPPDKHRRFIEKYSLPFSLLSDEEGQLSRLLGAYSEEKKRCLRKTYIIDASGKIVKIYDKVKPDIHASEVIEYLKTKV